MSTCATGCGRPTERMLCGRCLGVLRADLGDVAWLDEQLELVLSKQVALTEQAGGRSAETPLPLGRGALKARSVLRNRLVGWVRDMADPQPVSGPVCVRCEHPSCALIRWSLWPQDTLPDMAVWLMMRESEIAMHSAAKEIHGEIREAVGYAARIVDLPANRTTFAVGPCPAVSCPGEVRVFIPAERDQTASARMECGGCGQVWEPSQWSRLGKRILARRGAQSARVDSEAAAALLGVTSRTVRNWITAGRLENHGDERRVMVELAELERVLDAA